MAIGRVQTSIGTRVSDAARTAGACNQVHRAVYEPSGLRRQPRASAASQPPLELAWTRRIIPAGCLPPLTPIAEVHCCPMAPDAFSVVYPTYGVLSHLYDQHRAAEADYPPSITKFCRFRPADPAPR